jgi:hypothetical protein
MNRKFAISSSFFAFALIVSTLNGCGNSAVTLVSQSPVAGTKFGGSVHGGKQHIIGASIQLYSASTAGDASAATALLAQPVTTDAFGDFTITGLYTCPSAGSLVYLVARGGNPGLAAGTNNAASTLMATLGACGSLTSATLISMNELTTVASVFSLAPFMRSYGAVGSGSSDEPQLALAFAQASLLVNMATGTAPGIGLPTGFSAPVDELNTLADLLSTCINSPGGTAGDNSPCGNLFSAVKPSGSGAATETAGAALQMAQNPSANVAAIFGLVPAQDPFNPTIASAPASWSVAISPALFELYVDAGSARTAINPNIYGIASGLNTTLAQEIKLPNIRWGGDATTRYNWQVDSSNSGFDWYFVGGSGTANPVPGASPDAMINTYKPAGAGALMTIPIIPYVNKLSAWTCSFPTSVYGAQQSTNPYVHPNGENCGNSLTTSGAQLTDTNILANHIPNSVALQQGWVQHLIATFGTAANGGVPFYQLDNEPLGWSNTHRDVEPTTEPYSTIVSLGQEYAAMV